MGIPASRSSLVQNSRVHVKAEMKAASWKAAEAGQPSHTQHPPTLTYKVLFAPLPLLLLMYISQNVMFDNSIISPQSFYVICYVISRFYEIKDTKFLHGRYEGGTSHQ